MVEFDILYSAPNESIASFADSQAYAAMDDEQQMLIDIEQNIANLERTISTTQAPSTPETSTNKERIARFLKRTSSQDKSPVVAAGSSDKSDRKRSSTLRTVRNLMRIGKQRPSRDTDEDDEEVLVKGSDSKHQSEAESAPLSRACSQSSLSSNADSQASVSVAEKGRKSRLGCYVLYVDGKREACSWRWSGRNLNRAGFGAFRRVLMREGTRQVWLLGSFC